MGHLVTYRVMDRELLGRMGPKGTSRISMRLIQNISNLQSGMVYVLIMVTFTGLFLSGVGGWSNDKGIKF